MGNKSIGVLLLIVGVLLAALSLLADVIGIGGQPDVIGWKQLLGAGAGVVIAVVGVIMARRRGGPAGT